MLPSMRSYPVDIIPQKGGHSSRVLVPHRKPQSESTKANWAQIKRTSFRMPAVELGVLLLVVFAPFQPIQGEDLWQPNLTFVSKDYSLFVKWLPPDGSPPGISYTVLWRDSFDLQWEEVQHCRNTTETICNITCVFQEPSNRYSVKVESQSRTWAGIIPSVPETIDYILHVQLAPPVLRVTYTKNILGVNIYFTYPPCMEDIFQDLTYDLEIWRVGFHKLVTLEDAHQPSLKVNTTDWPHGEHCLHARTSFFRNGDRKWSNFSEPLCLWLHKEDTGESKERKWEIVALPLLVILATGVVMLLFYYKHTVKQFEMPSALDFSKYHLPKDLPKVDERKMTLKNILVLEQKNTPVRQTYSQSTLSTHSLSKDEESDEEEENCSPIPYTETLRFQKEEENCSTVDIFPKCSGSSSGSGDCGKSWPAAMMSEPFFTTEWMTTDASSGLLEKTFLSEDSIMGESVSFAIDFSAAGRECQDIPKRDINILDQLMFSESLDLDFFTNLKIRTGGIQCRSIYASLENSQTSLCSEAEVQVLEERRCENDSDNCETLHLENSLLGVSCKGRAENGERVENNTLKSACHNCQPKESHYISRT